MARACPRQRGATRNEPWPRDEDDLRDVSAHRLPADGGAARDLRAPLEAPARPPARARVRQPRPRLPGAALPRGGRPRPAGGRPGPALATGDAFVVAPGVVVTPTPSSAAGPPGSGSCSSRPTPSTPPPRRPWSPGAPIRCCRRSSAAHAAAGSACPSLPADRAAWLGHLTDLDAELRDRRDGYADAARAHLALLLVRLGRLQSGRPGRAGGRAAARRGARPDRRPLPRADLAARRRRRRRAHAGAPHHGDREAHRPHGPAVDHRAADAGGRGGCSPTPTSRSREIAPRVGYREAGYFVRRFRTAHGVTPGAWRRAGRRGRTGALTVVDRVCQGRAPRRARVTVAAPAL